MTTLEIIFTVVIGLITLILIGYYAIKIIKNNYINKIYDGIVQAMKRAESLSLSGPAKKEYVLNQVKATCKDLDIPYDFIAKLVSKVIENVIKGYNSMIK